MKRIIVKCKYCGKEISSYPSVQRLFCSRDCTSKYKTGERNPFFGKKHTPQSIEKNRIAHMGHIPWNKGKSGYLSEESRRKIGDIQRGKHRPLDVRKRISLKMKGVKKPKDVIEKIVRTKDKKKKVLRNMWVGRLTELYRELRLTKEYKAWRKKIYERDGYRCTFCGDARGRNLEADHIIPLSIIIHKIIQEVGRKNIFTKAMNYKPLWDIANGRTLCVSCHKSTESYGKSAKNYLRDFRNKYDLILKGGEK